MLKFYLVIQKVLSKISNINVAYSTSMPQRCSPIFCQPECLDRFWSKECMFEVFWENIPEIRLLILRPYEGYIPLKGLNYFLFFIFFIYMKKSCARSWVLFTDLNMKKEIAKMEINFKILMNLNLKPILKYFKIVFNCKLKRKMIQPNYRKRKLCSRLSHSKLIFKEDLDANILNEKDLIFIVGWIIFWFKVKKINKH